MGDVKYLDEHITRGIKLRGLVRETTADHINLRGNPIPEDVREQIALEYLSLKDVELPMFGLITRIRLLSINPEDYDINQFPEEAI